MGSAAGGFSLPPAGRVRPAGVGEVYNPRRTEYPDRSRCDRTPYVPPRSRERRKDALFLTPTKVTFVT